MILILMFSVVACDGGTVGENPAPAAEPGTPSPSVEPESRRPVSRSTPPPERSEIPQLLPVDHALRSPSFLSFRDDLLIASREKNAEAVIRAVSPTIRTTFGNGGGLKEFQDIWHPEDKASALWVELPEVLALGGSFTDGTQMRNFCAPYAYSAWPEDVDAFENVVVIQPGTLLKPSRDAADDESTPLGYEFLKIIEGDPVMSGNPAAAWRRVETADNKRGWVRAAQVRSPIDYRACFTETDEGWKMNLFVAGD